MSDNNLAARVKAYLEAFDARNLTQCLDFYADDAVLTFHTGVYKGRQAIETWHKERFAADLRLIRLEGIAVRGNTATVEGTAASNRLRAWRISSINGIITFVFENDKVREAKFAARMGSLEMLS